MRAWAGSPDRVVPLPERCGPRFRALPRPQRERLALTLTDDLTSEYDARFLLDYLRALPSKLPPALWSALSVWERDEQRHFQALLEVAQACFGFDPAALARRQPDFEPLAHLFDDPLAVCLLLAYDERVTVEGYRAGLPLYDLLGADYGRFVRGLVADEARHYASFLEVVREGFGTRLGEVPALLQRILGTEGSDYRATFVLDHDDPVYCEAHFQRAARALERALLGSSGRRGGAFSFSVTP